MPSTEATSTPLSADPFAAPHRDAAVVAGDSFAGRLVRVLAWPGLLMVCAAILAVGFARGSETLYFNLSYAFIIAALLLLEWRFGYRAQWQQSDGQLFADLGHTLLNKGLVQALVVSLLAFGVLDQRTPGPAAALPLTGQVVLGLVVSEFGLYWAHRLAHEWPWLWRFHAVHHSVHKLWIVNTGRFHFVDSLVSVAAGTLFLLISGISMDAIVWVSAITAWCGILTHCNVDTRCGPLSVVFNTPELHRWHHAIDTRIGNHNYGENLMLWDHLFGTWYHRPQQHVGDIGIREAMPARFIGQLAAPFRWKELQARTADH